MVTKAVVKVPKVVKEVKLETKVFFDPTASINDDLDAIAKNMHLSEGAIDEGEPMSTGNLTLDIIMGGGIKPAMYTFAGMEQSSKTTNALMIMAAGINAKIPAIRLFDYEGSSSNSLDYIQQLLKTAGVNKTVKEVFGVRNDTTGKWVTPPIVRYSEETVGEVMFDYMNNFLRKLPDKKRIAGKWWYIYEDSKINKAKYGEHANLNMSRKYGSGIYIEAEDGRLQGLIITDSLPAMNPTANDEDEANNSLALQARMFAKHFPRIKGRMAPKRVALIATNQLRDIPMARYGPTTQEPCGQAARFNSDCRNWFAKRALSGAPFNPKGFKSPEGNVDSSIESEPSVDVPGGFDTYSYIGVTNVKNKMSNPKRKGWIRLWTEDANGVARGIDPVFDTINYLKNTGQLICKNRRTMTINLDGFGVASKNLTWAEIKQWILGDKKLMSEISTKIGYKPLSLRAFCFKQIKDKSFENLYNLEKNAKSKNSSDDEDNED